MTTTLASAIAIFVQALAPRLLRRARPAPLVLTALRLAPALLTVLTIACGQEAPAITPTPTTATAPATPTPSPTPSPTISPTPTATPEPTPTESSATPTPDSLDETVYLTERYQGRSFQSAQQWRQVLQRWEEQRPDYPGLILAARGIGAALEIGRQLREDADTRNDKWKHCMLGAGIAGETDLKTARYAAWFKEYQDLTDGRTDTSFDELDFDATVDGARQALSGACQDCAHVCAIRWGDRTSP